jgi:hypothetical protein
MFFVFAKTKNINPRVLDNALVLAKIVNFEKSSIMSLYFNNSWTLTSQIAAILLSFQINLSIVSFLIFLIPILILFIGSFYISFYFTKNEYISGLIVFCIILFDKNIGITDYPILLYHESNFGTIALCFVVLIIGFLFRHLYKYVVFLSIILFSIHPIVGLFSFMILLTTVFAKYKFDVILSGIIKNKYSIFFASLIFFISLLYHIVNMDNTSSTSNNFDYNTYINKWDYHRSLISYNLMFIVSTTSIISFLILRRKQYLNNDGVIYLIIFSITSISLYLLRNLFFQIPVLNRIMVSRFSVIVSIPMLVILISISISIFSKYFFSKYYTAMPSIVALLLIIIVRFNFGKNAVILKQNIRPKTSNNSIDFWDSVNSYSNNKFVVTTYSTTRSTLLLAKVPYILDVTSMDFIPYFPHAVTKLKLVIEDVYGIDFESPPKKHNPSISDYLIKDIFESRTSDEWRLLSKKYNFDILIVPKDFNLKISNKFSNVDFICYIINKK